MQSSRSAGRARYVVPAALIPGFLLALVLLCFGEPPTLVLRDRELHAYDVVARPLELIARGVPLLRVSPQGDDVGSREGSVPRSDSKGEADLRAREKSLQRL